MRAHFIRFFQNATGDLVDESTSVRVLNPGTTTLIPESLYTADTGETTRTNPFTIVDGKIDFYLDVPRRVKVGVQVGANPEVFYDDVDVVSPPGTYFDRPKQWDPQNSPHDAIANGTVDEAGLLNGIIDQMAPGDELFLRGGSYYRADSTIDIDKAITIKGDGAKLKANAPGHWQIDCTGAGGAVLEGLIVEGSGADVYNTSSGGIRARGASAAVPYNGIKCTRVQVLNTPNNAFQFEWAKGIRAKECYVKNYTRGGFLVLSGDDIEIDDCTVDTGTNAAPNANNLVYPIALTRFTTGSEATYPRTTNFRIRRNKIYNNPWWEGIDTHGGRYGLIEGNYFYNVYQPIALVGGTDQSAVEVHAPQYIIVRGNIMVSSKEDGTYRSGIVVDGAGAVTGTPVEEAVGIVLADNIIYGYGLENTSTSGGIFAVYTRGLIVQGNYIERAAPHGIILRNDNRGFMINGNVVCDCWSNALTNPSCVNISSTHCVGGYLAGTVRAIGTKSATNVNTRGFQGAAAPTNSTFTLGSNYWEGATSVINPIGAGGLGASGQMKFGFAGVYTGQPIVGTDLGAAPTNEQLRVEVNRLKQNLRDLGLVRNS